MYSTCIFCHSKLGTNESVEHFPIGRRLAFDAARGRLWVVCRTCERWNLSPLEERWEGIEECERLFSNTRMRVSTDNVGLARLREGLELVRIGSPLRPEMAAWRYGDQFGRRRRKHLLWTGVGVAVPLAVIAAGPITGAIAGGWGLWQVYSSMAEWYQGSRIRARLQLPHQVEAIRLRREHLNKVSLMPEHGDASGNWLIRIPHDGRSISRGPGVLLKEEKEIVLRGDDAIRAAGQLLPAINAAGASRAEVADAVRLIEYRSNPNDLFRHFAVDEAKARWRRKRKYDDNLLINIPSTARLALEMAAHEESERRALEGELAMLEAAWQNAEEIAAIADDMFVPDATRERLSELKGDA